jgi:hypothetical protein
VIAELLAPRHFFAGNDTTLGWETVERFETPGSFRGPFAAAVADAGGRRSRRGTSILSRGRPFGRAAAVRKLDVDDALLHVTRAILCRVHERSTPAAG